MPRVLIVDDDPRQLPMLARLFSLRGRDLSVETAVNGHDAIERLQSMDVDLILTDLQMPEMSGFELLAWILSHQPQVPVFTMTAFPDAESVDRLRELGSIECFTKPLDVRKVLERMSMALNDGVRGHVRNISLASFLQLVEMDRKTCTLAVESQGRVGFLSIEHGVLVHAHSVELEGNDAAIEIAMWPSPAITIMSARPVDLRSVDKPLNFLLMEAMRKKDEAARRGDAARTEGPAFDLVDDEPAHPSPPRGSRHASDRSDASERADARSSLDLPPAPQQESDASEPAQAPPDSPRRRWHEFVASEPTDADALAIVDVKTGKVWSCAGTEDEVEQLARVAAAVFRAEVDAVAGLGLDEGVHELVLTTPRRWTVLRPISFAPETLAMVVFDPQQATLVMERRELETLIRELEGFCGQC